MQDDPDTLQDHADADRARRGSPYLNSKQAARYLNVSEKRMRDMRTNGRGPRFVRVGRAVRYHIRDLVAFVKEADGSDNHRV